MEVHVILTNDSTETRSVIFKKFAAEITEFSPCGMSIVLNDKKVLIVSMDDPLKVQGLPDFEYETTIGAVFHDNFENVLHVISGRGVRTTTPLLSPLPQGAANEQPEQ